MAPPTWVPGQVLAASDVNNWFVPLAAYKTVTTTRTTLTASIDPDLQFTVAANAFYEVHAGIGYNCASAGILYNFVIPAATNGIFEVPNGSGTAVSQNNWNVPITAPVNTTGGLLIKGLLATAGSGGIFGFQWASSSGPASLAVNAYSYLTARRVG